MATAALRALRFGVRFNPSAEEAIGVYLRRRVAGERLPDTANVIYEADVYNREPKDLAAAFPRLPKTHNRFFFTTCQRKKAGGSYRMSRSTTTGPGRWKGSSGKKEVKNSAGETIGYQDTLKYVYNDNGRKSEWRMDEYRCCGQDGMEEKVLCRVYVLPKSEEGSVTLQESLAGDLLLLGMQERAGAMPAAAEQQQQQQQQQPRRQEPASTMAVPVQQQQQRHRQEPATTMAVQQQQPRRQEAATTMAVQQQQQRRRQEPATTMAVQQQQPRRQEADTTMVVQQQQQRRRQEPATTMAVQQQQRRRQEPVTITQPQAIKKPPPPQTNTQQAPKRPAPQVVELPRPKRTRPTLAPLQVPLPPAMPQLQQQASRPSPRATPRRRPLISPRSRSRPVAPPPPRPAAEARTNDMDMDEFARDLEAGIIQGEAGKEDKLAEPGMAQEEDHAIIQEETGNDTRFSESQLELTPEQDCAVTREEAGNDDWLLRMMEADVEAEPGADFWDGIAETGDVTGDVDLSLPLSEYEIPWK